jgi:transposase
MKHNSEKILPKELVSKLHGASLHERILHRLHSVALVVSGRSASEAARIYGDSPRAVAYWVTRYEKEGVKGLGEDSRPGRPAKLNPSEIKKVHTFLNKSRERSKQVTANALQKYIKQGFGVTLTTRQCFRILAKFRS